MRFALLIFVLGPIVRDVCEDELEVIMNFRVSVHTCLCICLFAFMHACMYVRLYDACTHVCMHACMKTCMICGTAYIVFLCMHAHACMLGCMHVCMVVGFYVCVCAVYV